MSKYRVLLTDHPWPDIEIERETLAKIGAELIEPPDSGAKSLAEAAGEVDGILTCWAKVPAEVLQAATRCRIVSRLGIGLDNIDVAAATSRGMLVTNVPDYCLPEVAEHTLALLLALGRKVAFFHQQTQAGRYDLKAGLPLRRIAGQTLGVIGLGNIGRTVAEKAQALGLRVLATTRSQQPAVPNVQRVALDELLAECDYVSLHVPLSEETKHLMGREQFVRMKPTAYLINTARGGLVDHEALAAALSNGEIAGAALDVQEPEPPDLSQPPYNDPRVIVTPHAAFCSEESLAELRRRAAEQVVDWLSGKRPEFVVNPEVL